MGSEVGGVKKEKGKGKGKEVLRFLTYAGLLYRAKMFFAYPYHQ